MNGLTKEYIFTFFSFIGGFGMFLYGMHIMAEGLQKSAGTKMKGLLGKLTNNRFLAITVGALVTAIIQSSSATTVMIVGFVNAGLFNLSQAVGVIMGANIGTTITSWIVSSEEWLAFLKPSQLAPLAIGAGAILLFFSKSQKKKQIGEIIIGFGLLLFAYLLYLIWAIVMLLRIADSVAIMDRVEAPNTCAYDTPFLIAADIQNPSDLGVTIHW